MPILFFLQKIQCVPVGFAKVFFGRKVVVDDIS